MIIPYAQVNGEWNLDDMILSGLWNKIEEQRLHVLTFKDRDVKSIGDFFMLMKSPQNIPCINVEEDKPICVAWINGIGRGYGFIHYFFFKEFWGKSEKYAQEVLDYWWALEHNGKPVFNVLLGLTPPENKHGLSLTKRMGFTILGEIPQVGVVSYKER